MNERTIQLALPAGTVLRCGGGRYTLGEVTGFGGSSVFYTATKEGSALPFGIKECCPGELAGRLRRENGILSGTDRQADYALAQARARMLHEAVISQDVAAVSARSIPVWDAPESAAVETAGGTSQAPAGSFLVLRDLSGTGMFLPRLLAECALPRSEGHPLRTGGRPGLHTVARILEQTLRALELVHVTGYLYGDVQPENIFFADARPEKGDIGFACLLDFGCTRVFDDFTDGEKTARIKDRMVFSTPGYTAPEIVWGNDGTLRLTPAADVYSAGRLLLFLLRGRTYFENGRDRVLTEGAALTRLLPAEGEKLGCTGESLRLLQRLLDRSLALEPEDRYSSATAMLEDAEELVRLTRPPKNQLTLSFSALAEGEFLGREEKLAELDRALRQRRKPVVLWGFAGMGKTELAIEFARQYTRGEAYFVRFRNSVRETVTGPIADGFSGYDRRDIHGREKPEEQIYREVMKLLGERSENDLLILDNMDGGEGGFDVLRGESAFRDLCALPMGLLVTTRSQTEGGVEADALPRPLLRRLLRRFVPDLSNAMADALITAVEGHTLTVELMGRTLKHSIPRLSPEALLEKLAQEDLDSRALAKVSSAKDREGRMARIQGHLTALFRLSDLPREEMRLLCYALPIPPEGFAAEDFARVPEFDQDRLLRLIDRGWIRRSPEDILTLHPLVQETGWRELRMNTNALANFAVGISSGRGMFDFRCSNEAMERILGYVRGVYRHTGEIYAKTAAGTSACILLKLQGRFEQELEQAWELLRWAVTPAVKEADPSCERDALILCANALKDLGRKEEADACRSRADGLGVSSPKVPAKAEYYLQSGMTGVEAERTARMKALQELAEQKRYEEAVQKYEEERRWFQENDLDTTYLDMYAYAIYQQLGDPVKTYMALRRACGDITRGKRFQGIHVMLLMELIKFEVRLEHFREGQALMAYTAEILRQLFPEDRRRVLAEYGDNAVRLAWKQGWTEEYAAWLKLMTEALLASGEISHSGPGGNRQF